MMTAAYVHILSNIDICQCYCQYGVGNMSTPYCQRQYGIDIFQVANARTHHDQIVKEEFREQERSFL